MLAVAANAVQLEGDAPIGEQSEALDERQDRARPSTIARRRAGRASGTARPAARRQAASRGGAGPLPRGCGRARGRGAQRRRPRGRPARLRRRRRPRLPRQWLQQRRAVLGGQDDRAAREDRMVGRERRARGDDRERRVLGQPESRAAARRNDRGGVRIGDLGRPERPRRPAQGSRRRSARCRRTRAAAPSRSGRRRSSRRSAGSTRERRAARPLRRSWRRSSRTATRAGKPSVPG